MKREISQLRRILRGAPRAANATLIATAVFATIACSSSITTNHTSQDPPATTFGGTYSTTVSVTENACGTVTVMNLPTIVTHNAATRVINLSHGGSNYPGTVKTDSTFTTSATTVDVGDGNTYSITIAGKFGVGTLNALVTLDRTTITTGSVCRYVVRWVGTRS